MSTSHRRCNIRYSTTELLTSWPGNRTAKVSLTLRRRHGTVLEIAYCKYNCSIFVIVICKRGYACALESTRVSLLKPVNSKAELFLYDESFYQRSTLLSTPLMQSEFSVCFYPCWYFYHYRRHGRWHRFIHPVMTWCYVFFSSHPPPSISLSHYNYLQQWSKDTGRIFCMCEDDELV